MLDYGKVTDTIYKRSVKKVIERNVPGAGGDRIGGRDILYFAADSDKAMLTASATLTGNQLAAAGAVHLAVNRLAAAGAYALAVNIQLIVSAELPEKSIKALMGSVSESCGKLHITSVQADVAAVPGLTKTVITATAIGEAGGLSRTGKGRGGPGYYHGWLCRRLWCGKAGFCRSGRAGAAF